MPTLKEFIIVLLVTLSCVLVGHCLTDDLEIRAGPLETFRMRDLDKIPIAYRSRPPNYLPVFRVSEEERGLENGIPIPNKPARDDGIGRMLLKNLRFRDLNRRSLGRESLANLMRLKAASETEESSAEENNTLRKSIQKRQSGVSDSQLAELLHLLKSSRSVGADGVKLQSLRFGK